MQKNNKQSYFNSQLFTHKHHYVNYNLSLFSAVYYDKPMSKTVSSRLSNKRHDELRERCNELGCTMNEFIENCIYFMLDGSSEFDFNLDDESEEEIPETKKPQVVLID